MSEVFHKPMTNFRADKWEQAYPGSRAAFKEIFGVETPSLDMTTRWALKWQPESENRVILLEYNKGRLGLKEKVADLCQHLKIHPLLWDYQTRFEKVVREDNNVVERTFPQAVFYYDEHMIMFKLAWEYK